MIKFILKCFSLILMLFFGVLLGMQQANDGLLKMKGYEDQSFQGAFNIETNSVGEIEAAVLGERITAHNIQEKQEKLEEIKAFNFFSSIGSNLAEFLSTTFEKFIQIFIYTLDKILSAIG